MRADQIVKGDELWGRTVTESFASVQPDEWLVRLAGLDGSTRLPCDAELDVVRPPKLIQVELPEETVKWYATGSWGVGGHPAVVQKACRKALADREANQT